VMVESLAEACHALGQPATVLLSSIEILKLEADKDEEMRREMIDLCYGAVIQLRGLLQQMNAKRMYAAGVTPFGAVDAAAAPREISKE